MRYTNVLTAVLLFAAAAACNSERLTGADARRAVAEGKTLFTVTPDSIAVFVDDVRQPSGAALTVRDDVVERIEIVKGAAARAMLGLEGVAGAIYIYTKKAR